MNRVQITQFIKANMVLALAFVKDNADVVGITPSKSGAFTQSIVNTWTSTASDEQLLALAEAIGYDANSAPAKSSTPIEVAGLNKELLEVETANGTTEKVPCYMLPVRRWDTERSKNGILTPVLKLNANGVTVKAYNEMFRDAEVVASINKGDTIPVRVDSLTAVSGVDNQGRPYTFYRGAILEASQEAIVGARSTKTARDIAFASLDKEAQKLVIEQSAQRSADAFMKQFVK